MILPGGYHDIFASRCAAADDAIATVNQSDPFDAHVRLSPGELERLEPQHLCSGIDDAPPFGDTDTADTDGSVVGYTEWTAPGERTLSMGWDWVADGAGHSLPEARWHTLRTNVMLVGPDGADLGKEHTRDAIAGLMARRGWERIAARAVALPEPPGH